MSRSVKHFPAGWWCYHSAKKDKRVCNRGFRRVNRERLKDDRPLMIDLDEYMTHWDFRADGKAYFRNPDPKWLRK
jgi:hypothetical protein